jgi:hypothetical protein
MLGSIKQIKRVENTSCPKRSVKGAHLRFPVITAFRLSYGSDSGKAPPCLEASPGLGQGRSYTRNAAEPAAQLPTTSVLHRHHLCANDCPRDLSKFLASSRNVGVCNDRS